MDSHNILQIVYEIQGASDGAHPEKTLAERMAEIHALACEVMRRTGFVPD